MKKKHNNNNNKQTNKKSETECFINNRDWFPTPEAGSPRWSCWRAQCLGTWFLIHKYHLFTVISHGRRGEGGLMALSPFLRAPPSKPNHLPKSPPPNPIILGLGFQHVNLMQDTVSDSNNQFFLFFLGLQYFFSSCKSLSLYNLWWPFLDPDMLTFPAPPPKFSGLVTVTGENH